MTLYRECVHTTGFSAGSCFHVTVYFVCLRCVFIFRFLYYFYSNDLVLDHVIKLFFVLYRAVRHGAVGWTVELSDGQNERTECLKLLCS